MGMFRRWLRRTRTFAGAMSLRSKLAVAVGATAVLLGALWLLCRPGEGAQLAVIPEVESADVPAAIDVLKSNSISANIDAGKLLVSSADLGKARTVLAYEGLTGQNLVSVFEQLSRETDIWSTSDQNDKRWQAAKMSTLSRLIGMFPPVRSATVIYEPGQPRRLGNAGSEPTASVKVRLKPDATMDRKLVIAIAELVSGSIAGMSPQNVHIIDNGGRSYRVNEEGVPDSTDRMEQLRLAEDMVRGRILQGLAHIKSPSVAVRFEPKGQENKCKAITVAVPWSYWGQEMASSPLESMQGRQVASDLDEIRGMVKALAGVDDDSAVSVSAYNDLSQVPPTAAEPAKKNVVAAKAAPAVTCGLLVAAGLVCGVLAVLRRRKVRALRHEAEATDTVPAPSPWASGETSAFAFLAGVDAPTLLECLRSEHPQTIALVLSQVDPDKSAAVLGKLLPVQQVEVSRRILSLERIDADVADQIAQTLRQRLSQISGEGGRASGMAIITRILHQANPSVEQSVLNALSVEEPGLADSIRNRMVAFEDLALLPAFRLRGALENFDSEELAVALRTASHDLKTKIVESLSPEAAGRLRDEMERLGPVRLSDVEAAQQHVAQAVHRRDSGTYVATSEVGERMA